MKLERSKNTARNVVFGFITRIYALFVPFLMRTALIYCLGMQYVGLNSLFSSVLSVLNLAELGVGSALIFSMYEPLANDDTEKICALMQLYKIFYRIIGLVILVAGIACTPFLPKLVKGDIPDGMNLYILFYINLFTTVLTYWLFAYKNCLLFVHQRNDITDKIGYVINTVRYLIQLVILFFVKDYYLYIIAALFMGVVNNIVTAIIVDKTYPQFKAKGKLPKEEKKAIANRVKDLFTVKIGSMISNAADTIVISAILGLTDLALYQNYYYIISSVLGFITLITASSRSGIGNSLVTETKEKNLYDLKKLTFAFAWIGIFCSCSLACLMQPFIRLWVGADNMLDFSMVILFCVYFFVTEMMGLMLTYKDAAGIWHQDRFRPLITSLTNLGFNILLVNIWGLYGVLLSTVISIVVVGMPWLLHNLFSTIFDRGLKSYVISILKYIFLAALLTTVCVLISDHFLIFSSLILTLVVRAILCVILPNLVLFVIYRKRPEFKSLILTLDTVTKGKLKILKKLA